MSPRLIVPLLLSAAVVLSAGCSMDTTTPSQATAASTQKNKPAQKRRQARLQKLRAERRQIRRELARLRHERAAAQRARERRAARRAQQEQEQAVLAARSCNYDPCLTPASDYDCEGGSGDGPAYTGYVRVTGYDEYDLDNDGDGVACES